MLKNAIVPDYNFNTSIKLKQEQFKKKKSINWNALENIESISETSESPYMMDTYNKSYGSKVSQEQNTYQYKPFIKPEEFFQDN